MKFAKKPKGLVIDLDLLAEIREMPCALCGRTNWAYDPVHGYHRAAIEAHHIYHRGLNGGTRVDIRENLLPVCGYPRDCHLKIDLMKRPEQWEMVAKRDGGTAEEKELTVMKWIRPRLRGK